MNTPGPNERVYPVREIDMIVKSLAAEGVPPLEALKGVQLSKAAVGLPATRVSLNQIIQCYSNANRLARDPCFSYHAGLTFHVSTYGLYGFAILCSPSFRQTAQFAVQYHELGTPLADIAFEESGGNGVWSIAPVPHPLVDATLYRFLVEHLFGTIVSLHRDVMGPLFAPRTLRTSYGPPANAKAYPIVFGCPVQFNQPCNQLIFDAKWLDGTPTFGNAITYFEMQRLCQELLDGLKRRIGLAGKVRSFLLANLPDPTTAEALAHHLHMTPRTLRRKLRASNTSFRTLSDELKMQLAIKYLRETDLAMHHIAHTLGFSEVDAFRHAFRRWTKRAPLEFRARHRRSHQGHTGSAGSAQ